MNIVIPPSYRRIRAKAPLESVSIGSACIELAPVAQLEAAQKGYGIVPEGEDTDWQEEWVVIGAETLCGDPIFIDTSDKAFPVYTAAQGMGEWSPQLLASSFPHFIQILERLQVLARGRANPVELQSHPITDKESEAFTQFIASGSPDADLDFWQGMYETDN